MAYVEWHQEIRNHHKTDDLMRRLKIPRYQALGIIGAISSWAIGNRPGGIIENRLVHIAVEWDKDPAELLKALLDSEWLDHFDEDRVEVHDWEEITQGYRKARKDAKRKRDERADRVKAKEKSGRGESKERPRTQAGQKRAKTVRGRSTERRAEQNRTERTEQSGTNKTQAPRSSIQQQPQNPQSSGPSETTGAPERDVKASVVAVPEKKRPDLTPDTEPQDPHSVTERLQKQVSIRLSAPILEAIGVDGGIAEQLARSYPAVRILHVAEHAKKQDNPGGWARTALEKGWTVPDSNGTGLRNLLSALEDEVAAKDSQWEKLGGGVLKRAPDFPKRIEGEGTESYTHRVNEWMKTKKTGGQA